MAERTYEYGRICHSSGMGGFLNPPTHPEHTIHVTSARGDTFSMSLSQAANHAQYLDPATKAAARTILASWQPLPIEHELVQRWIAEVLGYYRNCYVGQDEKGFVSRKVEHIRVIEDADALLNADIHCGVLLIRSYYPDFKPEARHFASAQWGKQS